MTTANKVRTFTGKGSKFQVGLDGIVECPECGSITMVYWNSKVYDDHDYLYFTCKNGHRFSCGFAKIHNLINKDEFGIRFHCQVIYEIEDDLKIDYHEYIQSPEWKERAKAAKEVAGWKCQLCNKAGSNGDLHTHHRTYERLGHEDPGDLIVLCADCHAKFHDKV